MCLQVVRLKGHVLGLCLRLCLQPRSQKLSYALARVHQSKQKCCSVVLCAHAAAWAVILQTEPILDDVVLKCWNMVMLFCACPWKEMPEET